MDFVLIAQVNDIDSRPGEGKNCLTIWGDMESLLRIMTLTTELCSHGMRSLCVFMDCGSMS